ncbi:hypothetical protein ACAX46_003796 [Providencia rettgeri]
MKSLFHGFYELSEEDEKNIFLSKKTIFVFDTNCFFNLYRCEKNTREEVMTTIEAVQERIWFPFQVCFEYQRNRLSIIKNSLSDFSEIEIELKKIVQILGTLCGDKLNVQGKYKSLHTDLCVLRDKVKEDINEFVTNKVNAKLNENDYISKSDEVRSWLDLLSKEKIGKPLNQDQVDKINKIGERRYKYKVGPGWGDDSKKQEYYFNGVFYSAKYGDLYLWNEILNKSEDEDVDSIVFVTNDVKSDWWFKLDQNDDVYGPLEVLKTELISRGNCNFKMYTQPQFLKVAKNYLTNVKINELSIKELENISSDHIKTCKNDKIYNHILVDKLKTYINDYSSFDTVMRFMDSPEMRIVRDIQNRIKHTHLSPEAIEMLEKAKKLQSAVDVFNNRQIDPLEFLYQESDSDDASFTKEDDESNK